MSGVTIRPAWSGDEPLLARVASEAGYAKWTEARFTDELAMSRTHALIAEAETKPVGFAIGWKVMDELELHLLVVDPAHRRRGLGRALLAAFEEEAPVVHLEVSEHNEAALALYRAAGYTEVGRRRDYYATGDAAILMRHIRR